ncbi:RAP (Vertebrate Rap GTPase family) [Fasciola hepatica]|uniref:RAP (Vertebrate Rap GTPase family) n=1 Tax=Fasciola hepatica TaxID=6192 RepID=A0A4E0RV87_FASHE|nr:RAP (Vertebrate Rap GTPase family) [Fasciola hepatica]
MRRQYSLVVLGSGGVGKSALTVKFVSGKFVEKYDPTIEDFYRKDILVDGVRHTLEILDTAGTEQFSSLRDLYIKNGQCFLVVYSLISRQTFSDIRSMRDNILRVKGLPVGDPASKSTVPVVLVGNKADLAVDGRREVEPQEAEALAAQWACPHVETSARDNFGVNDAFLEAVRQMLLLQPKQRSFCVIL